MSLTPPPKVQKLQAALHVKAKGSPDFRFYALYDKMHREGLLWLAPGSARGHCLEPRQNIRSRERAVARNDRFDNAVNRL